MATEWMKSLQCKSKSRAFDDVVQRHKYNQSTLNSKPHLISSSTSSCRKSVQNLKDVVETAKQTKPRKTKPKQQPPPPPPPPPPSSQATSHSRAPLLDPFFPALTELPAGHPSRNVVEIIFHTSWISPKSFSGRVEIVFKVQNPTRTVARFEEYRELVKSSIGCEEGEEEEEDHARCVADGNEVMRFQCLGPTSSAGCGGAWSFNAGKKGAICTYSSSGEAHESAGGGKGRRAILVCRVIAGRVCKQLGFDFKKGEGRVGFNSVSGVSGELLVFDSRAVLPCFLVIYLL